MWCGITAMYSMISEEQGKDTTKMVKAYETFMKESTIINNGKLRRLTVPYHKMPRAKNAILIGVVSPYLTWKAVKWQCLKAVDIALIMMIRKSLQS